MLKGSLSISGNRALIGPLNKSMVGLGNPVPIVIDVICSKTRLTSLLLSKYFDGLLEKLYECFHLSIALVVVC